MQRWLIVFALAGLPLVGAGPDQPARPPEGPGRLVGAFKALAVDQQLVKDAKAAIQSYFTSLKLETVLEAEVQVVAGSNFRLTCEVREPVGAGIWRFVIWRRLDGTWRLTSARRRGDVPAAPAPGNP